ncbi:hypothetical protein [Streptomyces sp. NPDC020747]|uniref:hypothetical protein n=1 Tax=Streptomyces sp. NPDC020747 TaxID=3365086 RepID=UPI003789B24A
MSEPKRSHSAPLDLPDRTEQLEPTPVEGCAGVPSWRGFVTVLGLGATSPP